MDDLNRKRMEFIRDARVGDEFPRDLFGPDANTWGPAANEAAKAALDEIERLRVILRCCQRGADIAVDLGNGETIALYQRKEG